MLLRDIKLMYKVLHVPKNVGGNPGGLSKHLNILGVKSTSLLLEQKYFNYPVDKVVWKESDPVLLKELKRLKVLLTAAFHYDIVHYNFGRTLSHPPSDTRIRNKPLRTYLIRAYMSVSQLLELQVFRFLRKPLFIHYQGSDARPLEYSLENCEVTLNVLTNGKNTDDIEQALKRKSIERMGCFCEQIYTVNPDLLHILPKGSRFIPYCHISLDEWQPVYTQNFRARPLRIGHAPTIRKRKGTDLILNALDELKSEGYSFEFVLVEGLSHAEARKKYESVDVLIDQLFIGWYGGVAVEAMALGKPVLVYIRENDLQFIPQQMRDELPFIRVTPYTIKEGLRLILEMSRDQLLELAKQSREYVEKWHDPTKIAQEIKNDYEKALSKYGKL